KFRTIMHERTPASGKTGTNITKEEMAAIHNLKNNREITILPADKGRTTVIMDTEQYEKQMNEMLQDRNTYEVLKRDPTEAKKRKLKTILKQLQEEKKIDKQTYNHLIPTANIIPRIYGTPKIHKPGAPLRPIIDSMGSVTYNLSKFIDRLIGRGLIITVQPEQEGSIYIVKRINRSIRRLSLHGSSSNTLELNCIGPF
uniref:Uncharacterized protein n=1 Tax=Oryzias latipes TaxID=8090 RepID=A0A3P9MND8_ORYLA